MMILRSSPPSPFGRKVKLALGILGLENEVTIEKADPTDANDTIRQQNPIGKIPALITEDGMVIYDFAGDPRISRSARRRRQDHSEGAEGAHRRADAGSAVRRHSRCLLLLVYEGRWRPAEMHVKKWTDYQAGQGEARVRRAGGRAASRSIPFRTWGRSRSPARSAIRTCASAANGAAIIPSW